MTNKKEEFKDRLEKCFQRIDTDGKRRFSSEEEFAKFLGVSRPTVNMWLNGKRKPKQEFLVQISKKLGVTADWLSAISDEDEYSADESVKISSEYTGLSQTAVEKLHELHDLGATDEISALNYLLEKTHFYHSVLWEVWHLLYVYNRMPKYEALCDEPDLFEELSGDELDLLEKVASLGYHFLESPTETISYYSRQCGDAFASFINTEIEKSSGHRSETLQRLDRQLEEEYISGLETRKKMKEEEENEVQA